ncbi:ExsB family transcriptional regulator [Gordonibacter sp.]|uniref:ExsB family transcriptional regulator n=1 Tax=Gordonibacter sp. TaxID=1968902 RepID=UPI0025BFE8CD|nr:ExsB family transcriptional regulator [Gordonibacter sp.]
MSDNVAAAHSYVGGEGQRTNIESLDAFFARTPRVAVAFSGGCDSSYLVAVARAAGADVRAYLVRTAFQPPCEIADGERLAAELGVPLAMVDADVLFEAAICENGPDRCYLCKRFIFSTILKHMEADGWGDAVLADGTNATDDPTHRPGFRALAELGVVSPLRRAGLSKDDVRAASRKLGLFTANKPSFSCLAVHVPERERITAEALLTAARSPEVTVRLVARNAAIGADLDTTCSADGVVDHLTAAHGATEATDIANATNEEEER